MQALASPIADPGVAGLISAPYLRADWSWNIFYGNFPPSSDSRRVVVGIILAQNDDGPLKWANGPYPIQIIANFQILMGHLKLLWALCKIDWTQESLITTLEHNWLEIWIACKGPSQKKVHFSKTLIVFSQNGSGPILGFSLVVVNYCKCKYVHKALSQHNWKIVDWDVKNEIKPNKVPVNRFV